MISNQAKSCFIIKITCKAYILVCIPLAKYMVGVNLHVFVNIVVSESIKDIYNEWYGPLDVTEMDTVSVLNDMKDVGDGWGSCSILNTEDVNLIINDICTK